MFNFIFFFRLKGQNGAFGFCKASSGGSGIRSLISIECPKSGYKIPALKEIAKSSILFIVPLNNDIDDTEVIDADTNTLSVSCSSCEKEVPLRDFGTHKLSCSKKNQVENPPAEDKYECK